MTYEIHNVNESISTNSSEHKRVRPSQPTIDIIPGSSKLSYRLQRHSPHLLDLPVTRLSDSDTVGSLPSLTLLQTWFICSGAVTMRWSLLTFIPVLALLQSTSGHPARCSAAAPGKALYLITNDQINKVVALRIGSDGSLSQGTSTATGGSGSNSIDGSTQQPAAPDALVSQGSLTVAGNVGCTIHGMLPTIH